MNDKITTLYGLLTFNPFCLVICFMFVAQFVLSWYLTYRRTGWKIDFWYFSVFFAVFLPVLIMYGTSSSDLQSIAVGSQWTEVEKKVDTAFLISLFGYCSMLLGRYVFDIEGPSRSSKMVYRIFGTLETTTRKNIASGAAGYVLAFFIPLLVAVVAFVSGEAGLFKTRTYFLENESFRSVYNLLLTLYPLVPVFFFLRNFEKFSFRMYCALVPLVFGSVFLGTRGAFIGIVMQLFLYYSFGKKGAISLAKVVVLFCALAVAGVVMGALRDNGGIAKELGVIWFGIFYGNNFSDLRDFAWTLASWDGDLFLGKTYLAAFMSFVPRTLSDFREQWAFGVVTAKLAGFTPQEHAGIRPGLFGESYLNFGLGGVFVVSFVNGYLLRYGDFQIKRRIGQGQRVVAAYVATLPYFISSGFFLTSGFWGLYVFLLVQVMAWLLRLALRRVRPVAGKVEDYQGSRQQITGV